MFNPTKILPKQRIKLIRKAINERMEQFKQHKIDLSKYIIRKNIHNIEESIKSDKLEIEIELLNTRILYFNKIIDIQRKNWKQSQKENLKWRKIFEQYSSELYQYR